jgi:transposase
MIGLAAGTRIWIVAGVTDMRRGFVGLSGMVQTALQENPFSGQVFIFRGRRGDLVKVLWFDGDGLCLFAKRLERGRFIWPQATSGTVSLTPAQLSMLLEGIDWRRPEFGPPLIPCNLLILQDGRNYTPARMRAADKTNVNQMG